MIEFLRRKGLNFSRLKRMGRIDVLIERMPYIEVQFFEWRAPGFAGFDL